MSLNDKIKLIPLVGLAALLSCSGGSSVGISSDANPCREGRVYQNGQCISADAISREDFIYEREGIFGADNLNSEVDCPNSCQVGNKKCSYRKGLDECIIGANGCPEYQPISPCVYACFEGECLQADGKMGSPCIVGEDCNSFICHVPKLPGYCTAECETDVDCTARMRCTRGFCLFDPVLGDYCAESSDCGVDQFCILREDGNNFCSQECDPEPCFGNYNCSHGICLPNE